MTSTVAQPSLSAPSITPRAVGAALIGNFLEFYDFLIYGYFATYIAKTFFPAESDVTAILLTFATFGVGFLMRPIGAIVIGAYGDRAGRKPALVITILLMASGTVLIGLIPGYGRLGALAPLLVVLARSMQGFSAGGEWGGASSFLVEYAPSGRRGLYGSLHQVSVGLATVFGTTLAALLSASLSAEQLADWGWRIPFLLGGIIAPIGLYLRARVADTPVFERSRSAGPEAPAPILGSLHAHGRLILTGVGLTITWTVSSYVFQIYMPTFVIREIKLGFGDAQLSTALAVLASIVVIPLMGALSDRIGRKPLLMAGSAGFVLAPYPLFELLVRHPTFGTAFAVQFVLAVLYATFVGAAPAALCELFPTRVRVLSVSIGYNLAVTFFGGFAPFIATYLIARTGSAVAPAFYVMAGSLVSFVVAATMRERFRGELRH